MHAKIHTATSVLCVHFQFSFHLDKEVTRALSARKAVVFLVYFQPPPFPKKQVFKKTYEKGLTAEKRAERDTHTPLFFPRSSNSSNTPAFIYTSHTHKFESSNHVFDDNQHLVSFGQTAFLVFLEAPHEGTTETTR